MSKSDGLDWDKLPIGQDQSIFVGTFTENQAQQAAIQGLSTKLDPEPEEKTPDPATDDKTQRKGGPVTRSNQFRSNLGSTALESLALNGYELSKSIRKRADEMYRNKFPLLIPAFQHKCTECGLEHDEHVEECDECDSTDLREASQKERQKALDFFKEVNKEGQSLQQLYKFLEMDHGRLGVALHIVKKKYTYADSTVTLKGNEIIREGEVVDEEPQELIRGDPKRVKPVVDKNGRIGGFWWTCPKHRQKSLSHEEGHCKECGCQLKEVYFAETESPTSNKANKFYFKDEIITWAFFNPRLNGLDGISPVSSLWLSQAILEWMRLYAGAFYDQSKKRYPGKMVFVHTTNSDAVEKQLDKMQSKRDDDEYAQGFIYNEFGTESNTAPEVQVVDMMTDEILGQSQDLRKEYKTDIRASYGLTDVQDSELEQTGGLNAEGLQLEVNDRSIASSHQDMQEGPLRKLMKVMGWDEWRIKFVDPKREEEELSTLDKARAIQLLKQADVDFEIEDDGGINILGKGGAISGDEEPDGEEPFREEEQELDLGNLKADDEEISEALGQMEEGFKHIVWNSTTGLDHKGDPTAKNHQVDPGTGVGTCENTDKEFKAETWADIARDCPHCGDKISHAELEDKLTEKAEEPFYDDDEEVPEFVQSTIKASIEAGTVSPEFDEIEDAKAVEELFEEKLTQSQGWSLQSLKRDITNKFNVSAGYATTVIYDQLTNVLNKAREIGYSAQDDTMEQFHWVGPDDEATTDCCNWIKEQTKDGVTLSQLKTLVQQAHNKFFSDHPEREWTPHFGCRHSFTQQRS